jgi:Ni,Fe-hydrogenase I large subunit
MTKRILGPFNRVEGDLEVKIDVQDGRVTEAWVTSPMYRGFEQILHGKDPRDTLIYTPRICGICSVSQSVAAARALGDAMGASRPPNGDLAINLIHACENLSDHFTHFYLFFMPDFAREVYADEPWHGEIAARFKASSGSAAQEAMKARAEFMHLMGILAGKWPHTLGIQPGGCTRPIEIQEKMRLLAILGQFRRYLEERLFGVPLEQLVEVQNEGQLQALLERPEANQSDFGRFAMLAKLLKLSRLGRSYDRFMSYGVYPNGRESLFRSGVAVSGELGELQAGRITEDISHSWMQGQPEPQHPFQGVTLPDDNAADGYTWCKAPRLGGEVMEVGALARQIIDGQPLITDLANRYGSNVQNRVFARLIEIPRVLIAMEGWCRSLQPKEPFCLHPELPAEAEGFGLTEAARGSLGHWLRIRNGRILNYQIIAPTTWNFSPRDQHGIPGPLEKALVDAPIRNGERDPVSVQHIVRSFDPCMVCTVH